MEQTYVTLNNGAKIPQFGPGVGAAVKEKGNPRGEVRITSRLWPGEYGDKGVRRFNMSLAEQEKQLGAFKPAD